MKVALVALAFLGCGRDSRSTSVTNVTRAERAPVERAGWTFPRPVPIAWKTTPSTPSTPNTPSTPSLPAAIVSSPGPLSLSHAAYDSPAGCLACHDGVGSQIATPDRRCLACHDALGDGLHAHADVVGKRCVTCHSEHKSRGFDIMGWKTQPGGASHFDHGRAGWPLPSEYRQLSCESCHSTTNTQGLRIYRGLDRADF